MFTKLNMKLLILTVFLLPSIIDVRATASTSGKAVNSFPIFNDEARSFFVIVVAESYMYSICGGVIIENNWVLTAAQCFHDNSLRDTRTNVILPDIGINEEDRNRIKVSKVIFHPRFNNNNLKDNNIALLKLEEPLDNFHVLPLCRDSLKGSSHTLGTCGYNRRHERSMVRAYPDSLTESFFYEAAPQVCCETSERICAVPLGEEADFIPGDAGSPLYVMSEMSNLPSCVYGVTGLIKAEIQPHGDESIKVFYSSVPHHFQWLITTIAREAFV